MSVIEVVLVAFGEASQFVAAEVVDGDSRVVLHVLEPEPRTRRAAEPRGWDEGIEALFVAAVERTARYRLQRRYGLGQYRLVLDPRRDCASESVLVVEEQAAAADPERTYDTFTGQRNYQVPRRLRRVRAYWSWTDSVNYEGVEFSLTPDGVPEARAIAAGTGVLRTIEWWRELPTGDIVVQAAPIARVVISPEQITWLSPPDDAAEPTPETR